MRNMLDKAAYFDAYIAPIVCSFIVITILPLTFLLPTWVSWENGILENLQAVILCMGALLILYCYRTSPSLRVRTLGLPFFLSFLLVLGRELNWGRVFFQTGCNSKGPVFISMHQMPGHDIIYGIIFFVIIFVIIKFIRDVPWRTVIFKIPFQKVYGILFFVFLILTILGDKGNIGFGVYDETMEEISELAIYYLAIHFALYYGKALEKIDIDVNK
jgi:hypothetical protein